MIYALIFVLKMRQTEDGCFCVMHPWTNDRENDRTLFAYADQSSGDPFRGTMSTVYGKAGREASTCHGL
jgi:hypothetical protein